MKLGIFVQRPTGPALRRRTPPLASVSPGKSSTSMIADWLQEQGVQDLKVQLAPLAGTVDRRLNVTVAKTDLKAGEVAIEMRDDLILNLARIFEDSKLAELLTTDKISELAVLTLFLMYEKKLGRESEWFAVIRELDSAKARSLQGVDSPLLWPDAELETFLRGSPLVKEVRMRKEQIQSEFDELDNVWYLSSVFQDRYAFAPPSEQFRRDLFLQAFGAIQASIVHLRGEGVSFARRFSIIPLGPPTLTYSPLSKAMFEYDREKRTVVLRVDRDIHAGEPVKAWCGPQTNARLLLNYGVIADGLLGASLNPFDKMIITGSVSTSDPLFVSKKQALSKVQLSTQHKFDLAIGKPLPANLLPWARLATATNKEEIEQVKFAAVAPAAGRPGAAAAPAGPVPPSVAPKHEARARGLIFEALQRQLAEYSNESPEHDERTILRAGTGDDVAMTPRALAALRQIRCEKLTVLHAMGLMGAEEEMTGSSDAVGAPSMYF